VTYTADQYRQQLKALLPPGRALSLDTTATLHRLLDAIAQEFARIEARARDLVVEAMPDTSIELLPDWERVLGLPDHCLPREDTEAARREAVLAKLAAQGGQSKAYFIELAASLGYPGGWIEEFVPFTATSLCTDPLNSDPWCFVWWLHVPQRGPGNEGRDRALECLINRYRPAHTHVMVRYAKGYVKPGYVTPGYVKGN
jgi:uncharacterized protein YmfQ (DUF2313 family)